MSTQRKRVLVVGINYAPEHAGIAPYTTGLAEHLVAEGHEVYVLAGLPSYPSWTVPAEYRRRKHSDEVVNGVRVRRLWHYVPSRQTAVRRGLYELSYGMHVAASGVPWKPDVVLAVVPSLIGGLAAARIARRHQAPLAVWVQDLMGSAAEQSGIEGGARAAKVAKWAEVKLLRRADKIAVIHDAFVDYVCAQGAPRERVEVVKNWSHIGNPTRERTEVRRMMGWPEGTLIALHTGNMGAKQALENVVEAARLADERGDEVRFVLMGDGSRRAHLEARGANVKRLEFKPPVAGDLYSDVLAAADVLVVNERGSAVEMSLPSKLTSYEVAGRPIVAAVPAAGATALEVDRLAGGRVVAAEEPAALLDAVLLAASEVSRRRAGEGPSAREVSDWLLG